MHSSAFKLLLWICFFSIQFVFGYEEKVRPEEVVSHGFQTLTAADLNACLHSDADEKLDSFLGDHYLDLTSEELIFLLQAYAKHKVSDWRALWHLLHGYVVIRRLTFIDGPEMKAFLETELDDGFKVGYYLWQSAVPIAFKEKMRKINPDLSCYLPEGYGLYTDMVHSFYYKKDHFYVKIALVWQAPDFNGALANNNVDTFLKRGYNVLAIDARSLLLDQDVWIEGKVYESYATFAKAHQIPLAACLEWVVFKIHGTIKKNPPFVKFKQGEHYVWVSNFNHQGAYTRGFVTEDRICPQLSAIISHFNIQHPLKVVVDSCFSWAVAEEMLSLLPDGSEVVIFDKYRIKEGEEDVDNNTLRTSLFLEKKLDHYRPAERNGISATDMARLHALSAYTWSSALGSTLYAKRHTATRKDYIAFEDEVARYEEKRFDREVIMAFIKAICSDKPCENEYEPQLRPLGAPRFKSIRALPKNIQRAFAGHLALGEKGLH
jgi:hypothetical protein